LQELAERSAVPVLLAVPARRWPPSIEAAIYFTCSEALTNVAKYAHASQVKLNIASTDTAIRVEVCDDGCGGADPAKGSGLRGLTDRVQALGGQIVIGSTIGKGTRLYAEIPLPAAGANAYS
jgi:signal transduction histidine kinase